MSQVGKLCWSLGVFAPLCALCANNNWQKSGDTLNGNWNEAGHWSGGVPVAAPPTGEGALNQRVVFPAGSYTVAFPEGKTVSTANMTLTLANDNAITMSGLGSTLLLTATDADNYQNDGTPQAFRFNYNGGNQGSNVTVADKKAPFALFSDFNVTMSRDDAMCKMILDGGLYDFLAPTGGTARTDTTIHPGYEGLDGGYTADHDFLTEVKNGASLRVPKLDLGSGFHVNTVSFAGGSNVVGSLTMSGIKAGSNPATMQVLVAEGGILDLGEGTASGATCLQLSADTATYTPYTTRVDVSDGSTLLSRRKTFLRKGWPTLAVSGGSNWQAADCVSISDISSSTGCVSIVDSTASFDENITIGNIYARNGETVGCLIASNSTVDVAGTLEIRPESKAVFGGEQGSVTVNGDVNVGTSDNSTGVPAELRITDGSVAFKSKVILGNKKASGTLTVDGGTVTLSTGLTLSTATVAGYSARLVMNGGRLELPDSESVSLNSYNAGTAYVDLNGGTVRAKSIRRGAASSTTGFTANGGTIEATSTEACLSGMQTAVLGEKGLTIDSAFDQTLNQDFTSAAGVLGSLVYTGSSTLTVPAGRSVAAKLVVKGGATLVDDGAMLGGLELGDTDEATAVAVRLGSPLAVAGGVNVVKAKLVLSGTATTGESYDLITSTGTITGAENAEVTGALAGTQYAELAVVDTMDGQALRLTVCEPREIPLVVPTTETISTNVTLGVHDALAVTVAEGAVCTFEGAISGGYVVKRGTGELVLSNAGNALASGVILEEGTLTVGSAAALGIGEDQVLKLGGGEFRLAGTAAIDLAVTTEVSGDVTIRTDVPTAMPVPEAASGAFVKTGDATLTWTVSGARTFKVTDWKVASGELLLKGLGADATVTAAGAITVGYATTDGTAEPGLVLDNVTLVDSGKTLVVGKGKDSATAAFWTDPYLLVTNGASLTIQNFKALEGTTQAGSSEGFGHVLVDDATMTVTTEYWANSSDKRNFMVHQFRNGAKLLTPSYRFTGSAASNVFDNATLAKNAALEPMTFNQCDIKTVQLYFRNGAVLHNASFSGNADRHASTTYYLNFDGATWDLGPSTVSYTAPKTGLHINVLAGGVAFEPSEGVVWTIAPAAVPAVYGGPVLVKGAGTVDLNGATVANAMIGGTGTLRNVALAGTKLTVCADVEAAGALTLGENVTCAATKGCVDFGRTEADPVPYKDLSYPLAVLNAGTVAIPDAASWRVANTGVSGLKGSFAADSGVLSLTGLDVAGLMLIFR